MVITKIFIFLIGLLIGSFLNVCIYRISKKNSIANTCHCYSCQHKLRFIELIPILSYFLNNRKCKYCDEKKSIKNPIIELITAFVFLLLYNHFNLSISLFEYTILTCLLITVSFTELEIKEIPDELIVICLVAGLLFNIYHIKANMLGGIIGFMLGGGIFLIIALITKGAFGGGNIKFMAVLGLYMGWKLILIIALLSFVLGLTVSIILIISKIRSRKDYLSLGPFIAISAIAMIFYGHDLLQMYNNIIYM